MKTIKVEIKKIWGVFREPHWLERQMTPKVTHYRDAFNQNQKGLMYRYDFERLEEELLDKTTPNKPIEVFRMLSTSEMPKTKKEREKYFGRNLEYAKYLTGYDYVIHNGNHRCYVLEKLHGEDYLIECTVLDLHHLHKK